MPTDVPVLNRRLLDGGGASEEHADALLDIIDTMTSKINTIDGSPASASGTGVTVVGEPGSKKLTVTFVNTPVVLADNAGVVAYGSLKVLELPDGYVLFHGASMDIALTKSSTGVNDDWDGDIAVGTVAANNGATLATTEQNLIPTTATPQAVAGVTTGSAVSTATESGAVHDGGILGLGVYLNVLVDDADHDVTTTPCNIIVNGTMTFVYSDIGDIV